MEGGNVGGGVMVGVWGIEDCGFNSFLRAIVLMSLPCVMAVLLMSVLVGVSCVGDLN